AYTTLRFRYAPPGFPSPRCLTMTCSAEGTAKNTCAACRVSTPSPKTGSNPPHGFRTSPAHAHQPAGLGATGDPCATGGAWHLLWETQNHSEAAAALPHTAW